MKVQHMHFKTPFLMSLLIYFFINIIFFFILFSSLQEHAQKAPERRVWKDGQYSVGLLYSAQLVSDKKDSQICPNSFR